jgi:thymidylate synthase (FAD)
MKVKLIAITPDAERVIEQAARVCYQSEVHVDEHSAGILLRKLLVMGHESPFEHAYATFLITDCSRAMTHQLVRHRLMAVCQKSQRYVSEQAFEYVMPPSVAVEDEEAFRLDMKAIGDMYRKWLEKGLRKEDARFVLPNACSTEIMVSANFREFRHIIRMRCSRHAQWEIRTACMAMLRELHAAAPFVFGDLAETFLVP